MEIQTRRNVLKVAPLAVLAPTLAIASNEGPTPVQRKFAEWAAMFDHLNNADVSHLTDDEFDAETDKLYAIERELMDIPCQTALDALCKVTARSSFGVYVCERHQFELRMWEEVKQFLGVDFRTCWA